MSEIRIPVPVLLLTIVAAIAAAVVAQLPEIQRYLKVKAM
jgi:Family of unknown function (DUF6893)